MVHAVQGCLVSLLIAFAPPSYGDVPQPRIRVGVSLPLSGSAAGYGLDVRKVLEFVNERHFRNRFDFIFEDDRCDPAQGVTIAKKFAELHKVPVVVGMACSGVALATAPVYAQNKITVVAFLATSPKYAGISPFHYRTRPSITRSTRLLADFISQRYRSVGIVAQQTEYALSVADSLAASLGSRTVLHREDPLPDTNDFRTLLARLRHTKPESLALFVQYFGALSDMVRQTRESGWQTPIVGIEFPEGRDFLAAVGPLAEGIAFTTIPWPEDLYNEEGMELYHDFLKEHGPLNYGYLFPLTLRGLVALHNSGPFPLAPHGLAAKPFSVFGDTFTFASNGEADGMEPVLKTIRDGSIVALP